MASFCFTVFSVLKYNVNSGFNHTAFHFIGKTTGNTADGSQQVSENNENAYEDDSDLEMEHIQLPYYFSFRQINVDCGCERVSEPLTLEFPKPIYLAIRQMLIWFLITFSSEKIVLYPSGFF